MDVSRFVDGIEKVAAERIKAEQGDYMGDDGLLICGKCHTPKQCRVNILGMERTPMCLCKCEAERREREEEERRKIQFARKVQELRRAGFPEARMLDWTFANDDGKSGQIMSVAKKYVENFDEMRSKGKGLLLYGNTGSGKTYAAACIANALIDEGYPCLVTDFERIANTVSGLFDKQTYYNDLNRNALLIIDDLATERKTEYMQEIVYNVINSRYQSGLPLIITTNLTGKELENPSETAYKRIFSRLYEMCIPVKVESGDRRRDILKTDFAEYKNILGI